MCLDDPRALPLTPGVAPRHIHANTPGEIAARGHTCSLSRGDGWSQRPGAGVLARENRLWQLVRPSQEDGEDRPVQLMCRVESALFALPRRRKASRYPACLPI